MEYIARCISSIAVLSVRQVFYLYSCSSRIIPYLLFPLSILVLFFAWTLLLAVLMTCVSSEYAMHCVFTSDANLMLLW